MTADTAGSRTGDRDGAPGSRRGGARRAWAPGDRVLWRYRANGAGRDGVPHICRPVTVVRDTPDLLAVWVAPGTVCVKPQLADGTPVHREPLATRYTKPRTTVTSPWFGTGVLKLARPGDPWSVWLFWDRGWRFKNFYVNLEEPRTRWSGGVDSEDHFLDIVVLPDGRWEWRDEDEFAEARRVGLLDEAGARRVREAGRAAVEEIREWGSPYADGWEHWRPDPHWPVPSLPDDWDRAPEPDAVERAAGPGAPVRPPAQAEGPVRRARNGGSAP
ncbi:cytidylyl-2-hydroxypropylphosphonate hydrolase [Streptomyces sp. NPDC054784]